MHQAELASTSARRAGPPEPAENRRARASDINANRPPTLRTKPGNMNGVERGQGRTHWRTAFCLLSPIGDPASPTPRPLQPALFARLHLD